MAGSVFIESDCTIEHDGHSFTAGGAYITPDRAVAYLATRHDDNPVSVGNVGTLTDWHGNPIGTYRITSASDTFKRARPSWVNRYQYHISARINGRRYYGRTFGPGFVVSLKSYKHQ